MDPLASAFEVYSGCPFYVDVPADGFVYVKIKRTESKTRWELKSEVKPPPLFPFAPFRSCIPPNYPRARR
tara:strand:+ start:295 stop:504 length:210 start_codon:yes stop_codon:yes gene_type:complete